MRLTGIHLHPLKSGAGRTVEVAELLPRGLADDRSWMVVDDQGVLVSARQEPRLLSVTADTARTDSTLAHGLRLRAPGMPTLVTGTPDGPRTPVRLHRQHLEGIEADDRAHEWLRRALGHDDLRLIWCDDPTRRRLNPDYSQPGDHTAFADGYPVTLASLASLRELNAWISSTASEADQAPPQPLDVRRFRPNLVIDGDVPFAEDSWREVTVGEAAFRVAKPVDRCVMTTIDPDTLARGKEPIRALARHRLSAERQTLFAVHLVPLGEATVRVGDPVSAR